MSDFQLSARHGNQSVLIAAELPGIFGPTENVLEI